MTTERSPTFAQGLRRVLDRVFADMHTAMPGEVTRYDAALQVADVRPLLRARVKNELGELEQVDFPVLPSVPVVFPAGGGFRLTFPLAVGDGVLLVFAESAVDAWQAQGGLRDGSARRFHLNDAIAVAGLHSDIAPWTGAAVDGATFGSDSGPGLLATDDGLELGAREGQRASEPVILGQLYRTAEDAALDALNAQLSAAASAVGAASAALTSAAAANAVPVVGGILAAPSFAVVVSQLATISAQLAAAAATLAQFKSAAASTLSPVVKTR